jgi:hypothetical protein
MTKGGLLRRFAPRNDDENNAPQLASCALVRAIRLCAIGPGRDLPDGQISAALVIFPVQPHLQKYFSFGVGQITSTTPAVLSYKGALRNVINAGRDAVDAGGASDEGVCLRTAKSCGPDASTPASSLRRQLRR